MTPGGRARDWARRTWARGAGEGQVPHPDGVVSHGPRSGGRFGWWGPMPTYTRRSRRGNEVSVGGCGCCLPIPLLGLVTVVGAMRALWKSSGRKSSGRS